MKKWLLLTVVFVTLNGCGTHNGDTGNVNSGATASQRPASGDASLSQTLSGALHETGVDEWSPIELRKILQRVFQQYRDCDTYADNTRVLLSYEPPLSENPDSKSADRITDETRLSIRFVRPNRLAIDVATASNRIEIRSDGTDLLARVEDAATANFGGQISRQSADTAIAVSDIYSVTEYADPSRPDKQASILLGIPLHLQQSQLGLLLHDIPLQQLLPGNALVQRLANQSIGSTVYLKLQATIPSADGDSMAQKVIYWIDTLKGLIRRIDLPTDALYQNVAIEERPRNPMLTLDLENAMMGGTIAESQFTLPVSKESRFVRYFVVPPLPLPSDLLGTVVGPLKFATLEQQTELSSHWKGKHAVLVWCDGHAESRATLREIERVYAQFQPHRDRVVFRAICVDDPTKTTDQQLRSRLNDWRISFPVDRDALAIGRDELQVDAAPSVVVIGADQKVHMFSVGADPNIAENVSLVLQGLLQGTDVGSGVVRQFNEEQRAFQRQLAIASVGRPESLDAAPTEIAAKSSPQHLLLTSMWTSNSIANPGNLIALPNDPSGRFETFVIDGLREIVKLDANGREVERYQPNLAQDDVISHLQHFTTKSGKRHFATWSTLGRRVYVFNSEMEVRFAYPKTDQQHPGIQDVLLADLDRNDEVELYVAFRDPVGLHRVSAAGERKWSTRNIAGVASISVDPAGFGRLLVCGDTGHVTPVFFDNGRPEKPIVVSGRAIHSVTKTATHRTRPTQLMGMSFTLDGRLIAIGMDRNLQEQWSYGLPNGIYATQVKSPTSAAILPGQPLQWLLAGPDGSVHIISDNGEFFDAFNSGFNVVGLTGFRASPDDDAGVLLLSADDEVRAYRMQKKSP